MASAGGRIFIKFHFEHDPRIGALDLSAFLFDMNRLYVVAFRAEQDPYEIDESTFRGYGRNFFRVPKAYQLDVSTIRFNSPGLIIFGAAVTCITAVWTTLQITQKIKFWPLQSEKLELEVQKLRDDATARWKDGMDFYLPVEVARLKAPPKDRWPRTARRPRLHGERQRIEPILELPVTKSAIRQLEQNPLKPTDVKVEIANDNLPLY